MIPHVLSLVPPEDMTLFRNVKGVVDALPDDIDLGSDEDGNAIVLSCHILARAIAKVFAVRYVDGLFQAFSQHSWVLTPNGNIIDVYPVGIVEGPLLVDGASCFNSPAKYLYTRTRISVNTKSPSFLRAVDITEAAVREVMRCNGIECYQKPELKLGLLALEFPQFPFAREADLWLASCKKKTIQDQLQERRITSISTLPMLYSGGLGFDEHDSTWRVFFNDYCELGKGFLVLGHEIAHTFHFDLTHQSPVSIVEQGAAVEMFCDAFSLRWMKINTREKVERDCNNGTVLDAILLMLSRASHRVIG